MSNKKNDELNELLSQVITLRREAPKEYEYKLKRFYRQRAGQMKRSEFNGVKLPEVKSNIGNAKETLCQNREITYRAECYAQQYLNASHINEQLTDQLKQTAERLQKFHEIEEKIRNSKTH